MQSLPQAKPTLALRRSDRERRCRSETIRAGSGDGYSGHTHVFWVRGLRLGQLFRVHLIGERAHLVNWVKSEENQNTNDATQTGAEIECTPIALRCAARQTQAKSPACASSAPGGAQVSPLSMVEIPVITPTRREVMDDDTGPVSPAGQRAQDNAATRCERTRVDFPSSVRWKESEDVRREGCGRGQVGMRLRLRRRRWCGRAVREEGGAGDADPAANVLRPDGVGVAPGVL